MYISWQNQVHWISSLLKQDSILEAQQVAINSATIQLSFPLFPDLSLRVGQPLEYTSYIERVCKRFGIGFYSWTIGWLSQATLVFVSGTAEKLGQLQDIFPIGTYSLDHQSISRVQSLRNNFFFASFITVLCLYVISLFVPPPLAPHLNSFSCHKLKISSKWLNCFHLFQNNKIQ